MPRSFLPKPSALQVALNDLLLKIESLDATFQMLASVSSTLMHAECQDSSRIVPDRGLCVRRKLPDLSQSHVRVVALFQRRLV